MDKDNNNVTFETGGAIEMLEARFEQIVAAKASFFTLKGIYPKVSTQVMAFIKADKAEKAKLLPTIRQQVETWLNSFASLLDTDKAILSKNNEQIAKIAAQLGVSINNVLPKLPLAYETAANAFIEAYAGFKLQNIIALKATEAEKKQFVELNEMASKLLTMHTIPFSLKASELEIQNMQNHFAKNIASKVEKLQKAQSFSENTPLTKAGKEKEKEFYSNIQDTTSKRLIELQDAAKKGGKNSPQAAQYEHLQKYQADLMEFAQNQSFSYKSISEDRDVREYDEQGNRILPPAGYASFDFEKNEPVIVLNTHPSVPAAERDRTAAHEMQHLIQYRKGQLAYRTDGKNTGVWSATYDIYDEVEAFQTEYIIYGDVITENSGGLYADLGDKKGDAWANVSDPFSVKKFYANYENLPMERLSLETPMNKFVTLFGQEGFETKVLSVIRTVWENGEKADIPFNLIPEHQALTLRNFILLVKKHHQADYDNFLKNVKFK